MREPGLVDKILAIDDALAAVPHAFGGAIALGYHAEPRATIDIDVNVFVPVERAPDVLDPLGGLGVDVHESPQLDETGQVRLWWGRTPVDLFFAYDPFHDAAARDAVTVPFADRSIRVLSATHLVVCKTVFDRPKDWVDIDAVVALGTHVDPAEVLRWVGRIVGDDDPRFDRVAAVLLAAPSG